MTLYRKCRLCMKRADCQIKRDLGKAISGLGITSILHKCESYEAPFKFGDPVKIETVVDLENPMEWGEDGPPVCVFPGHFIDQHGQKAHVYIKPGTQPIGCPDDDELGFQAKSNGFCTLPFSRVTPNPDSAPTPICEECLDAIQGDCSNTQCPQKHSFLPDPPGRPDAKTG